jgi:hypothetical protein
VGAVPRLASRGGIYWGERCDDPGRSAIRDERGREPVAK